MHTCRSTEERFTETNIFLINILISLLSSDAGWKGARDVDATTSELASLCLLQRALADMGAIDTVVFLISSAHDYDNLPTYHRDVTAKVLELAYELVHYGPSDLQDRFISHIEEKRRGHSTSKDFLYAIKAQLRTFGGEMKIRFERGIVKDVRQEEKRMALLDKTVARCSTLLLFLNMLCENHNERAQVRPLFSSCGSLRSYNTHSP